MDVLDGTPGMVWRATSLGHEMEYVLRRLYCCAPHGCSIVGAGCDLSIMSEAALTHASSKPAYRADSHTQYTTADA